MSLFYYEGDAGPVPAEVKDVDGVTPATPVSATATIVNQRTGEEVVTDASCQVDLGIAAYIIPEGSEISTTPGSYIAYLRVVIDSTTINTVAVPFDILEKTARPAVDRWRRKVEFAAPDEDAYSEEEGRDWIDQAVDYLNGRYDSGFSSMHGIISADDNSAVGYEDIEFFASVAALMARTAWFAGKGNWRDEEMSLDVRPFQEEWARLDALIVSATQSSWFTFDTIVDQWNMYNRDKIDREGYASVPVNYFDMAWDPRPDQVDSSWYV